MALLWVEGELFCAFSLTGDGTRGGKDETDGLELKLLAKIFVVIELQSYKDLL